MSDLRDRKFSATSFTVATGPYLEYWFQQATDADRYLFPDRPLQLFVFTDRVQEATHFGSTLKRAELLVVEVPKLGWPDATAKRYELIHSVWNLSTGDVLVHLDADMRIHAPVGPDLYPETWMGGIALVQHPGFYRPSFRARRMSQIKTLLRDCLMKNAVGGLGSWEDDPHSLAYVPRNMRRKYVCGGVWFGSNYELMTMCELLSERTRRDSAAGVMARWHDESHLNWYASNYQVTLLEPSYCFILGAPQLRNLPCLIEAVDKEENRVRS